MGRPCLCCCPDCNACVNKENFEEYDYALLICNVNSITDDNFDLYLNNILLGSVSELAENKCKGKWFVTSPDAVEKIKNNINNPCRKNDINPPKCCLDNTTSIQLLSEENKPVFFDERFTVFLKNKKDNKNGNLGFIGIWRIKKSSVCQIANGQYAGDSGKDITSNLSTIQKICCCDLIFKELVYEISGGNIWPAYDAFAVVCSGELGESTDKFYLWRFAGDPFPCRSSPPSINGTYILSRSSEIDDKNCITAMNSINTEFVTLNNDFSQIKVCSVITHSPGPGFKELSKKLCSSNPYTFEISPSIFVLTGNTIRCRNGQELGGWGNFPELKRMEPVKIKVTGIPE